MAFAGVIPEVPTFLQSFSRNLGQGVSQGIGSAADFSMKMALEKYKQKAASQALIDAIGSLPGETGGDLSKLSPIQQGILASQHPEFVTAYQKANEMSQKKMEKEKGTHEAISALDKLEGLVSSPGIGMTGALNFSDAARKNRGIFSSLQSAVLPLFKNMFPRGMTEKEFKFIQENYIPQPSDTEETIKGKIEGLRQLAEGMVSESGKEGSLKKANMSAREKFDISNPKHKARRDQVLKKTGNDREKAEQILLKEFDIE